MNTNSTKSRYLIKLNTDATKANAYKALKALSPNLDTAELEDRVDAAILGSGTDGDIPVWLVLNNADHKDPRDTWKCLFVWDFRTRSAESAFGMHNSPSGVSVIATDDLEVRLEKGGEFANLSALLEGGAAHWGDWRGEYMRVGIIELEIPPIDDAPEA